MFELRFVIARPLLWVLWHVWQIGDDAWCLMDRLFDWVENREGRDYDTSAIYGPGGSCFVCEKHTERLDVNFEAYFCASLPCWDRIEEDHKMMIGDQ